VRVPKDPIDLDPADHPSGASGTVGGTLSGSVTRRRFLGTSAVVAGAAAVDHYARKLPGAGTLDRRWRVPIGPAHPAKHTPTEEISGTPPFENDWSYFIQVEREADLAVMDFIFYDFSTTTDANGVPNLTPNADGCVVLVRFPPQAIGEGAYLYADAPLPGEPTPPPQKTPPPANATGLPFDPPPILSALSGPSQLAFIFNASQGDTIPLPTGTAADLLDWSDWNLSVVNTAKVQPPSSTQCTSSVGISCFPVPYAPGSLDTYIEFPYALYLSPTLWVAGGFRHASTVFENNVTPLTSSAGVTDVYRTSIVARPWPFFTPTNVSDFTPNIEDTPLNFAAIWCDDMTAAGYYNTHYNVNYDVTLWTNIYYGVPPT
jgi:hypothetical protein